MATPEDGEAPDVAESREVPAVQPAVMNTATAAIT
jgi:hypothetical protein